MGTRQNNTTPVVLHDRRLQHLMRESLENATELALMSSHGANLEGCEIVGIFAPEQADAMMFASDSSAAEDNNVIPYPRRPARLCSGQT